MRTSDILLIPTEKKAFDNPPVFSALKTLMADILPNMR